jgi:hypothetical protein
MRSPKLLWCVAVLGLAGWCGVAQAQPPQAIPPEQFDKILQTIKPRPAESRFQDIPWLLNVWDARKKAAEEGKPILIWSGSGGAPIGPC